MKIIAALFFCLLEISASAEKMNVKVIEHSIGEKSYTQYVPGFTPAPSAGVIYQTPHAVQGSLTDIFMTLLLPDGRSVDVVCQDHFWGLSNNRHNCKNPTVDA
ncbi:hypothetical protein [Tunturiibacter gelidiferens]|uniref:Uncharacterized protein n=1 Tax=Tunturiibacter gelidiferens TaxID=3069689 RepID=A0AAU7Z0F4_9BACT